jgi:hypothetical protein
MAKIKQSEASIHLQVCNYLRAQYPNVIFTSESSGIRLTMGQAVKAKKLRSGSKLPDLWILEQRGLYGGLLIELKAESIYKKDGTYKTDHIAEQAQVIEKLNKKGYSATFAVGFEDAKKEIDMYMLL